MKHDFQTYIDRKNTDCWKWDGEGATVQYPMGCADTDFKSPQPVIDAIKSRIDQGVLAYGMGVPAEHDQAMQGYYQRRHGVEFSTDSFVFTSGIMVAMKLAIDGFSAPGDNIIIQQPVFHNFALGIQKSGRNVVNNELLFDKESLSYEIDFEDLEAKAADPRTRMLILCNPHNPVGKVFSKEELLKIHEICIKHDITVFSDEVHGDIYFGQHKHVPYLSICEEAKSNAMICSASGKTFNLHGLYATYMVIEDKKLRDRFNLMSQNMHFDYSFIGALANTVAYKDCDYYIDGLVEYLEGNLEYVRQFLTEHLPSVKLVEPEATYLLWLDFSDWGITSSQIQSLLAEHGVGLANGDKFGLSGEGFMRLNFACHRDTLIGAFDAIKNAYDDVKKLKNIQ